MSNSGTERRSRHEGKLSPFQFQVRVLSSDSIQITIASARSVRRGLTKSSRVLRTPGSPGRKKKSSGVCSKDDGL